MLLVKFTYNNKTNNETNNKTNNKTNNTIADGSNRSYLDLI